MGTEKGADQAVAAARAEARSSPVGSTEHGSPGVVMGSGHGDDCWDGAVIRAEAPTPLPRERPAHGRAVVATGAGVLTTR